MLSFGNIWELSTDGSAGRREQRLLSLLGSLQNLFLLKTPHFSSDTAPWDEQGVQERDPRPENLLWPTFQLQAFFGGEKTLLNLGAWKLLPLSRNPGKEVSWGALSGLESKEAAQVWDGGGRNINDDAARGIPSFMGAQPRPGGCAETRGVSKSFGDVLQSSGIPGG